MFKKLSFASVLSTDVNDDFVTQRIEALKKFEASDSEYVLFLNNSVILHNNSTLNFLMKANQNVVAPMIRVNVFQPAYKQIVVVGYEEKLVFHRKFQHGTNRLNQRYHVRITVIMKEHCTVCYLGWLKGGIRLGHLLGHYS